ncbi:alpha-L-fucosidase [Sphingobacterium hotanense]|uniref:alpha-L-fucosidase n=1 Tax=Sphingobacterium hotanense TaxID=649196 RepID=UPI0021A3E6AF|nr:alpha-L-fucosidase [Sphingobacterium hotanense]MCT1523393.1 alpha-L-fucosidase [Sphingobacterium hotanense]
MKRTKLLSILLFTPFLSMAQTEPAPYGATPSERQLRWHEMEMYTLIHFTPTTFQNKEWGYGDADPKIFNPTKFDANQIAAAAAAGGFKGLISVAKHHDGFCLWPTATTEYSVASSPWKEGKGDMVREFKKASHANGLQFGVYLSAWDRNDTRYGTKAYADAYRQQLTELMSNYGELFTSWHDGANGGDGYYGGKNEKRTIDRSTYYEWHEKTWPIVRKLQPMAMIFSDVGPDMRWVGNEKGFAAETSWSTLTPKSKDGKPPVPGQVDETNLSTGDRGGEYWIPAECDVPQRPGWFYHEDQNDRVKTPDQLFEIYLKSVGRGGGMNLGLAPMPEGILHDNDILSLKSFGQKLKETFKTDLTAGAMAKASNVREDHEQFSTAKLFDGDRYSYYASDDQVLNPSVEISLPSAQTFDLIRLRENIKLGQRLDSVKISVWENNSWKLIGEATSIGANRLIKLASPVTAQRLKVDLFAPVAPTLSEFALFKEAASNFGLATTERNRVAKKDMIIISADKHVNNAIDNNLRSIWETTTSRSKFVEIRLTKNEWLTGMQYTPRQDAKLAGVPTKYKVYSSKDGKAWQTVAMGEFSNIKANATAQMINFSTPVEAHYIRFEPIEVLSEDKAFSVAEFDLFVK